MDILLITLAVIMGVLFVIFWWSLENAKMIVSVLSFFVTIGVAMAYMAIVDTI